METRVANQSCRRAARTLHKLERFILWQRLIRIKRVPKHKVHKEDEFIAFAKSVLAECDIKTLGDLLVETRGLSWYFAGYSWRPSHLGKLMMKFRTELEETLESLRTGGR